MRLFLLIMLLGMPGQAGPSLLAPTGNLLEGIVLSSPAHPNLDDAVQSNYRSVSFTHNNRTAYLLVKNDKNELEGGVKLVFQHLDPEARKLERYAHVKIDISGARVEDGGKVIRDIPNGAVLSVEPGSKEDIPVRIRCVRELTDDDLYTWVSIPDCEFVFKDGSYCNVLESYSSRMGTWQTLLTDADGAPLYALINAKVPWRRLGNGVPQGRGTLEGIYVKSDLPRYGKVYAPQIRPLEQEDFHFEWTGASAFTTLCEWNWNDNGKQIRTEEGPMDYIKREKVLPDEGQGRLYVDFEASTYRGRDLNNPKVEPDKGYVLGHRGQVLQGSLQVRTKAFNWWNWGEDCGNALVVKFSTQDISGERLVLDFSFGAGDNSAFNCRQCPVYWGVEVSTDDLAYARVDVPDITLRSIPWWDKTVDGVSYLTSFEAGWGLTEHQVVLPSSLFGQKDVWVRITPVKKNATTLAIQGSDNGCLRPNDEIWTFIEFGAISVRYR